jgi:ABC-type branched-subunit amino acid transport system ATPase component
LNNERELRALVGFGADRIHVLDYGRTLAIGAPSTLLRDSNVIAGYLGRGAAT